MGLFWKDYLFAVMPANSPRSITGFIVSLKCSKKQSSASPQQQQHSLPDCHCPYPRLSEYILEFFPYFSDTGPSIYIQVFLPQPQHSISQDTAKMSHSHLGEEWSEQIKPSNSRSVWGHCPEQANVLSSEVNIMQRKEERKSCRKLPSFLFQCLPIMLNFHSLDFSGSQVLVYISYLVFSLDNHSGF